MGPSCFAPGFLKPLPYLVVDTDSAYTYWPLTRLSGERYKGSSLNSKLQNSLFPRASLLPTFHTLQPPTLKWAKEPPPLPHLSTGGEARGDLCGKRTHLLLFLLHCHHYLQWPQWRVAPRVSRWFVHRWAYMLGSCFYTRFRCLTQPSRLEWVSLQPHRVTTILL